MPARNAYTMYAMSGAAPNNLGETGKLAHVGLVAARGTLRELDHVLRHLVVALLDHPMPLALICPSGQDGTDLPVPPLEMIEYGPMRLPFFRSRSIEALGRRVHAAGLTLLHALDGEALPLTQHLAAKADLEYVAGAYSLRHDVRAADHRCRALLAASTAIRQMLVESHAAPAEMIHLLRPGVHQVRSASCFADPNHATAIVASGELDRLGPFSAVLEAFAQLKQAGRECVFFLIGSGRAERRLRRQAEKLDLMEDLTFVGRQEGGQLAGILQAADIFVSPVPTNRLDIEVLTAMGAGVPVLTAGSPAADFVIENQTALTFPAGDSVDLAIKLFSLLDDHAAARSLAEAALAHLRDNHSPAGMADELLQLYSDVSRLPAGAD